MGRCATDQDAMVRWNNVGLIALLVWLSAGCAGLGPTQAEQRIQAEQKRYHALAAEHQKLQEAHQKLQESVNKQEEGRQDLDETLARLQLQLLEKQAHLNDLNKRYEQAVLEVVRAKAKLRSLESRAEAASNLAEAELAMKTLNSKMGERDHDDVQRAEELLRLGAAEFKKENYGGALYLTGQAKVLIREGQERSMSRENLPPMSGEIGFSIPVPLRALNGTRLRVGPGTQFKTLATLDEGASMTGYSYKGEWVRLRTPDGQLGWVHYKQVDGR